MNFFFFFGFGFGFVFLFYYYFFNIVLTWKIVEASKASVLYIYIDYHYYLCANILCRHRSPFGGFVV